MTAVFRISLTVIFYIVLMFLVNRSILFKPGGESNKNSEADIFIKQIIGIELIGLIILLTALYFVM